MDLLTLTHRDFTLQIDCDNFWPIWSKALRNLRSTENLMSLYDWSDGVVSVVRNGEAIEKATNAEAVFFDNADYPLWVEFNCPDGKISNAWFNSHSRKVAENFKFHARKQILSGFLNYGNEIGKSEIVINYQLESGEIRKFRFSYEVLSTKLNYHSDWAVIIRDIESEYRMLSIDFLKKTFHSFDISDQAEQTHDLIWWQVFRQMHREFVDACKSILDRPRHRLKGREEWLRADKIKRFTPLLENEFARFSKEPAHLYRTEVPAINNDTYENRFLKFAVRSISDTYKDLAQNILSMSALSDETAADIKESMTELEALNYNSFFRNVGPFKGISHESLILQNDTYYSRVYRTWLILQQSYSLNEGLHNLETKDIATLYEIWCFIQMKNIVRGLLGESIEIDNSSRIELNSAFVRQLEKGSISRVIFRDGDIELAELIYNPVHDEDDKSSINIENLYSMTVKQKPDIVLRLTKTDHQFGTKLTYLFDAKYRIDKKERVEDEDVDTPPEDAINQMHRYRDAIYYSEHGGMGLKKEVIGGYILFPGSGMTAEVEKADFYNSISKVNIGAFPLRPNDAENRSLLENFVKGLLDSDVQELLTNENIIPQKGLRYEHDEAIFGSDPLCIVGYANKKQLRSVRKNRMYYVRAGLRDGSIQIEPGFENTKYVILFSSDSDDKIMFELKSVGPRILTGADLKKKGFDVVERKFQNIYLAFELEEGEQAVLINKVIKNPNLSEEAPDSKDPFFIRFSQLFDRKD